MPIELRCIDCSRRIQPPNVPQQDWADLRNLLRRNCSPSSCNAAQLLQEAEEDILRCDTEIKRKKAELIALENQQKMRQKHVLGYRSLLSPIRKTPVEVLSHIFALTNAENQVALTSDRQLKLTITIPGLQLAGVCTHWSQVALTTKQLWSNIGLKVAIFDGEFDFGAYTARAVKVVQVLLNRANNHPLDVTLEYGVGSDNPMIPALVQMLHLLADKSRQWRTLKMNSYLYTATELQRFLLVKGGGNHLPILESIDILFDGNDADEPIIIFQEALNLRSAIIHDADDVQDIVVLPWNQIEILDIDDSRSSWIAKCVEATMLRVSLRLFGLDETLECITLPKLECLKVTAFSRSGFLDKLTLPSLNSISLDLNQTSPPSIFTSGLISLVSRSSCTLTELSWRSSSFISFKDWISLLHAIPSLQKLVVRGPLARDSLFISDRFFASLEDSSPVLLPNLETLDIVTEVSPDVAVKAIQSRWTSNDGSYYDTVCLKAVRLDLPKQTDVYKALKPLEYLRAAGLKVQVRDSAGIVMC
ncbi:hypothetical protein C8J56DRAFT_917279 [Mycena floridula]|nr:hypothetical protein C8J56DRAFT_917279 [Mycena floridula]